jgi:hypothetical protein
MSHIKWPHHESLLEIADEVRFNSHITNSMEPKPSWETASRSATQELPKKMMEPEASLPCPKETSTGPYSEPDI